MLRPPVLATTLGLFGALAALAGCSEPAAEAPSAPGVCWRMIAAAEASPRYTPIARDIPNLETCAVRLEGTRMLEGGSVTGVYRGHFIFASAEALTSSATLDGRRFRVFEPEARKEIQDGLRKLIAAKAAAPGPAGRAAESAAPP